MIPVGTLCIVVRVGEAARLRGLLGTVVTIVGDHRIDNVCANCAVAGYCERDCVIERPNGDLWCAQYSQLRPITPPNGDMSTTRPRETETA